MAARPSSRMLAERGCQRRRDAPPERERDARVLFDELVEEDDLRVVVERASDGPDKGSEDGPVWLVKLAAHDRRGRGEDEKWRPRRTDPFRMDPRTALSCLAATHRRLALLNDHRHQNTHPAGHGRLGARRLQDLPRPRSPPGDVPECRPLLVRGSLEERASGIWAAGRTTSLTPFLPGLPALLSLGRRVPPRVDRRRRRRDRSQDRRRSQGGHRLLLFGPARLGLGWVPRPERTLLGRR